MARRPNRKSRKRRTTGTPLGLLAVALFVVTGLRSGEASFPSQLGLGMWTLVIPGSLLTLTGGVLRSTLRIGRRGSTTRPAYPAMVLAAALVMLAGLPVVWVREDILWRGIDLGIMWAPVMLVAVLTILGLVLRNGWVVRMAGALGILYVVAFVLFLTPDFGQHIFYVLGLGPWMMLFASSAVFLDDVVRIAGPPGRRRSHLLGIGLVLVGVALALLIRAESGALGLAIEG